MLVDLNPTTLGNPESKGGQVFFFTVLQWVYFKTMECFYHNKNNGNKQHIRCGWNRRSMTVTEMWLTDSHQYNCSILWIMNLCFWINSDDLVRTTAKIAWSQKEYAPSCLLWLSVKNRVESQQWINLTLLNWIVKINIVNFMCFFSTKYFWL